MFPAHPVTLPLQSPVETWVCVVCGSVPFLVWSYREAKETEASIRPFGLRQLDLQTLRLASGLFGSRPSCDPFRYHAVLPSKAVPCTKPSRQTSAQVVSPTAPGLAATLRNSSPQKAFSCWERKSSNKYPRGVGPCAHH